MMKYEELVDKVRKATKRTKLNKEAGHIAFQFNVTGEAEGAFYIEIADGKINVEPYEYYDRDVLIITSADVILKIVTGEINPISAYNDGLLMVYGSLEKLEKLNFRI